MKTIILLASLMISSVTFAQEKSVVNFTEFKKEMGNLDQFNEYSLGEEEDLTCNGSYSAEYTWGGYASLYLVHADDAYDTMTLSNSSTTLTCGAYY